MDKLPNLNFLIYVVRASIVSIITLRRHSNMSCSYYTIIITFVTGRLYWVSSGYLKFTSKTECLVCHGPQLLLSIYSDLENGKTIHMVTANIKKIRVFLNSSPSFISNNKCNRKPWCPYLHSTCSIYSCLSIIHAVTFILATTIFSLNYQPLSWSPCFHFCSPFPIIFSQYSRVVFLKHKSDHITYMLKILKCPRAFSIKF